MAEPPSGADAGVPGDNSVAPANDRAKEDRVRERAYLIWVPTDASLTIGCRLSGRSRASPNLSADAGWRP
jgi:hypothetical protein